MIRLAAAFLLSAVAAAGQSNAWRSAYSSAAVRAQAIYGATWSDDLPPISEGPTMALWRSIQHRLISITVSNPAHLPRWIDPMIVPSDHYSTLVTNWVWSDGSWHPFVGCDMHLPALSRSTIWARASAPVYTSIVVRSDVHTNLVPGWQAGDLHSDVAAVVVPGSTSAVLHYGFTLSTGLTAMSACLGSIQFVGTNRWVDSNRVLHVSCGWTPTSGRASVVDLDGLQAGEGGDWFALGNASTTRPAALRIDMPSTNAAWPPSVALTVSGIATVTSSAGDLRMTSSAERVDAADLTRSIVTSAFESASGIRTNRSAVYRASLTTLFWSVSSISCPYNATYTQRQHGAMEGAAVGVYWSATATVIGVGSPIRPVHVHALREIDGIRSQLVATVHPVTGGDGDSASSDASWIVEPYRDVDVVDYQNYDFWSRDSSRYPPARSETGNPAAGCDYLPAPLAWTSSSLVTSAGPNLVSSMMGYQVAWRSCRAFAGSSFLHSRDEDATQESRSRWSGCSAAARAGRVWSVVMTNLASIYCDATLYGLISDRITEALAARYGYAYSDPSLYCTNARPDDWPGVPDGCVQRWPVYSVASTTCDSYSVSTEWKDVTFHHRLPPIVRRMLPRGSTTGSTGSVVIASIDPWDGSFQFSWADLTTWTEIDIQTDATCPISDDPAYYRIWSWSDRRDAGYLPHEHRTWHESELVVQWHFQP